jgi:hypothetical protein
MPDYKKLFPEMQSKKTVNNSDGNTTYPWILFQARGSLADSGGGISRDGGVLTVGPCWRQPHY